MNSRKISVGLKHLERYGIIVPVEVIKDFGKLYIYFEKGMRKFKKKLQKTY